MITKNESILMYDSVTAANLPNGALKYATYVNGKYMNYQAVQNRFPGKRVFGIDVLGINWTAASVLDYEKGDIQNSDVLRNWVIARNRFRPGTAVIYCNRTDLPNVEDALEGQGYRIWLATLDGTDKTASLTAANHQIVATQILTNPKYDTSTTIPSWM